MSTQTFTRLTISLPPEIAAKLDRLAESTQRTRSNAIARLITQAPEPKAAP